MRNWFRCLLILTCLALALPLMAAPHDFAEGTGTEDGATRDFYNRAAQLPWQNFLGDWVDRQGVSMGNDPYATAAIVDNDSRQEIVFDVQELVQRWVNGERPNKGILLRLMSGSGPYDFRSKEYGTPADHPILAVTADGQDFEIYPQADTFLARSTYTSQGLQPTFRVDPSNSVPLLRFDISALQGMQVTQATLSITSYQQYGGGSGSIGVFEVDTFIEGENAVYQMGLSVSYPQDQGIGADPAVYFATGFEDDDWTDGWTSTSGHLDVVTTDPVRQFIPFQEKALRMKFVQDNNYGGSVIYKFMDEQGAEPEEVYFRYYLRLGDDWNQTVQGGKLPGIAGTYGQAGWGGRKPDGTDGWSARGLFTQTIPDDNPLGSRTPVGNYVYHVDQAGTYGDNFHWRNGYRGYLERNRWYCIEQYVKLNTPSGSDGILRAWVDGVLAFEKTDLRFRIVPDLRVETIWLNFYHGGTTPSPYDQHAFVDNVVIASRYIGPLAEQGAPQAPANLRVGN